MSDADYRSYRNVVQGMNNQSCEEMAGYKAMMAEQARAVALEARIASLQRWMRTAQQAEDNQPSFLSDAIHHPQFSPSIFATVVYAGSGCVAGIAPGAAGGAFAGGTVGGEPGMAVGGAIGAVTGCIAGAADATYSSAPSHFS
jgi:hypothetical protein